MVSEGQGGQRPAGVPDRRTVREAARCAARRSQAAVRDGLLHRRPPRRTAVRNMRRAGVSQVVRMRITGHRTDSMERRYNIVDVEDIKAAKELLEKSQPSLRAVQWH